jgi:hypothetical protein
VKPILQALLLADHVYQDRATGKTVVAGVFDRLWIKRATPTPTEATGEKPGARVIPVQDVQQAGSPYAYINLREVRAGTSIELRFVGLESNEVFYRSNPIPIPCDDPLKGVELVIPVPRLPMDPGTYAFEVLCEDELIGSHRIVVSEIRAQE